MTATLDVLFEDESLLVIDKPSGVSVHRGLDADRDTIVHRLRAMGKSAHPVHRLDRGTSGVLVCAQNAQVAATLGEHFATNTPQKIYVALVRGEAPAAIEVDHPVRNGETGPLVPARTTLERLAVVVAAASALRERRYSLVRARPHTGRFHQIRRHLKHTGNPVIGDANYGRSEHNRFCRQAFGLHRLALHAASITLPHPVSGAPLLLVAPLPRDLHDPFVAIGLASDAIENCSRVPSPQVP
jgi:tRNA pseudouridine65 synthase